MGAEDRVGSGLEGQGRLRRKKLLFGDLRGWGRPWPGITYQEQCQERWAALAAVGRGQLSAARP